MMLESTRCKSREQTCRTRINATSVASRACQCHACGFSLAAVDGPSREPESQMQEAASGRTSFPPTRRQEKDGRYRPTSLISTAGSTAARDREEADDP